MSNSGETQSPDVTVARGLKNLEVIKDGKCLSMEVHSWEDYLKMIHFPKLCEINWRSSGKLLAGNFPIYIDVFPKYTHISNLHWFKEGVPIVSSVFPICSFFFDAEPELFGFFQWMRAQWPGEALVRLIHGGFQSRGFIKQQLQNQKR